MPKRKAEIIRTAPVKTALSQKRERAIRLANKRTVAPKKQPDRKIPPELQVNVFKPGQAPNAAGSPPGKRLLTRIREILGERSMRPELDANGQAKRDSQGKVIYCKNARFDDVADAFVRQMEIGNFQHVKEYIDREEGKVPTTLAVLDPDKLKLYVDVPVDGPEAP